MFTGTWNQNTDYSWGNGCKFSGTGTSLTKQTFSECAEECGDGCNYFSWSATDNNCILVKGLVSVNQAESATVD